MELEIAWDRYLWFQGINRNLYLVPGDSMYVSNDGNGSDSFEFNGGESGLINSWYLIKDSKLNALFDTVNVASPSLNLRKTI